jgi:hypothetical protein
MISYQERNLDTYKYSLMFMGVVEPPGTFEIDWIAF